MLEMSGYEAAKEIRKLSNDVIIIAQTAFVISGDWKKATNSGCNDYITKPLKKEQLLELIASYF